MIVIVDIVIVADMYAILADQHRLTHCRTTEPVLRQVNHIQEPKVIPVNHLTQLSETAYNR